MASQKQALNRFSTEHLQSDLRGRSVRGGVLTITSQGAQFVLQSVATVVLARLLTPSDYGLVAMVTAITGLGQAFADLGLSEATIQHPDITHEQVSTLFWINLGIGFVLMAITAGLAPVLAWFYREPRLIGIALVSSLTFLIGGLRVQHDALLQRQMRFMALTVRDIVAYVVAVPTAIIMAWHGAGYWAIVALPLLLNFTGMALSWMMVLWLPGLPGRYANVRSLVAFGGNVAASYLTINVIRSADNVLIGWRWGAGPLGLYSRAYNLLMLPVRQLGTPARSVAVPTFSRVQSDPERLARYYLKTANVIMWISAPIFAFLIVAANPVIILTLGAEWQQAAPVFQLLAIVALGQLLLDSTIWLLVSCGKSLRLLQLSLALVPVMVAGYVIGLPFGIRGVALSGSVALLAVFPGILKFTFHNTHITLKGLCEAILYPTLTSIISACLAMLALHLFPCQGAVSEILVCTLGFAAGCILAISIPQVRKEIVAFKELFSRSKSADSPSLA